MTNGEYLRCEDCKHNGKPTCKKRGYKWPSYVVKGCMIVKTTPKGEPKK